VIGKGYIVGGRVLTGSSLVDATLAWDGAEIASIGERIRGEDGVVIDARDCLVLPGIVDVHGDAFERCLMPRPGVRLHTSIAMAENAAHVVTSGITTSFVSVTDSFEPGLRSRATLREIAQTLSTHRTEVDMRLHVRHEVCQTTGHEELLDLIGGGAVDLLSINDHAPGGAADAHRQRASAVMLARTGTSAEVAEQVLDEAASRRPAGIAQVEELVQAAHDRGVAVGSHDPGDDEHLERDRALGMTFAEFPLSLPLAHGYRRSGIDVVLGAPNIVRGGSHLGGLSAADAVHQGAATVLCSDYHYPSLLHAPFLVRCELPDAWAMVSAHPARLAGLTDRGELERGRRADIVVVEPPSGGVPASLRAVVTGGRIAWWSR
jgi:alpha-D-ribose 1-methylphosphonate 5-triphosphate diphosphatase